MKKIQMAAVLGGGAMVFAAAGASAHVSTTSGPAPGFVTQEVTFGVGHGCTPAGGGAMVDTYSVTIDIPDGVTSVRPLATDFGKATITKLGEKVTSVTWKKDDAASLADDSAYYKLTIRLKPSNAPFTRLYFPAHQICRAPGGAPLPAVEWTAVPGGPVGAEPAPELVVLPARQPGWNKYTVPVDLKELPVFFKDALVVWKGNAGYSVNANTVAQISAEPGATALTELKANDEIWVRY